MHNTLPKRIAAIDAETLAPLVQQAINNQTACITQWTTEERHGGTFGVVTCIRGEAVANGTSLPWSLILKVVHNAAEAPLDRSNPANSRYWRREPLAYQSGLLTDLGEGLVAPRCFAMQAADDKELEEIWLWQEDVAENPPTTWSPERFALAARHFGQFNGLFLTHKPLPTDDWLGRHLLRAVAKEVEDAVYRLPTYQDHPLVGRIFPPDIVMAIERLWDERERFFTVAEQLPQTVCHRDANRRNLFHRTQVDGTTQTIAIDWEDVAIGAVGEELAALIILGPGLRKIPVANAAAFDQMVFAQYMAGLAESGWQGDEQIVRLGYTTACLRYGLALPSIFLDLVLDESRHAALEAHDGQTVTEFADHWAGVQRFIFSRIDEARVLMDKIG